MGKRANLEYKDYISKLVMDEGRTATDVDFEMELSPKTISLVFRLVKLSNLPCC